MSPSDAPARKGGAGARGALTLSADPLRREAGSLSLQATAGLGDHRAIPAFMNEGFCVARLLFDDHGHAKDFLIEETNAAFVRQTGLHEAIGRAASQNGGAPGQLLRLAAAVLRTGRPRRSQVKLKIKMLDRWYALVIFPWGPPAERRLAAIFDDITQRKLDELMSESVLDYAIFMLDVQGRIRTWSRGAENVTGHAREAMLGAPVACLYRAGEAGLGSPVHALAAAAARGRFDVEAWFLRRNGSLFWASAHVTALRDTDGRLQGYCQVMRDLTERKLADEAVRTEMERRRSAETLLQRTNQRLEAAVSARTKELRRSNSELRMAKSHLEQLSGQLITAQEQERARIARELHDDAGHMMTALRMQLEALSAGAEGATAAQCIDLADQTVAHLRRIALNLRPAVLDAVGLAPALEWLLEDQARLASWTPSFVATGVDRRYPVEVETACFRIVQEALTNAARHARASHVRVSVSGLNGGLVLEIADDGTGFDPAAARPGPDGPGHFGLSSMRERARLLGGELRIESSPLGGTRIHAVLPCEDQDERMQAPASASNQELRP